MIEGTWFDSIVRLAQVIEAAVVVLTLAFIAAQVRQNVRLARVANAQHLTDLAQTFSVTLLENPRLAELWYACGRTANGSPLVGTDRLLFRELLLQYLVFHENLFYQWSNKLLDDEIYGSWRDELQYTVEQIDLVEFEPDLPRFFPGRFGDELRRMDQASAPRPGKEMPAGT